MKKKPSTNRYKFSIRVHSHLDEVLHSPAAGYRGIGFRKIRGNRVSREWEIAMEMFAFLLIALIAAVALAVPVLLLFFRQTRVLGVVLLSVVGLFLVLGVGAAFFWAVQRKAEMPTYENSRAIARAKMTDAARQAVAAKAAKAAEALPKPPPVPETPEAVVPPSAKPLEEPSVPAISPPPPAIVPPKSDADLSQAESKRTVGMLRAMIRSLSKALAEEEEKLAAKKEAAPPTETPEAPRPDTPEKGEDEVSRVVANRAAGMVRSMFQSMGKALAEEEKTLRANNAAAAAKPPAAPETELPVAPPASRPAWVDAPPRPIGEVYQMPVTIGPYTTRLECDEKLPAALQEAVNQYVEECLGLPAAGELQLPVDFFGRLVKEQWEEVSQHSFGPMVQLHVLLQFDRKAKDRILEAQRQAVVARRLRTTGIGVAAGLGLLAMFFGYLKMGAVKG